VLLNSSDNQVVLEEDLCLAHLESVKICDEVHVHDSEGKEVRRLKVLEMSKDEAQPEFITSIVNGVHPDVPIESRGGLEQLMTIRQTLCRQPYDLVPKIDAYVDDMCKAGIIEPSFSPWASNLVVVKKKDGSYCY